MQMMCEWDKLLSILPPQIRADVDMLGKKDLQELRLRKDRKIQLVTGSGLLTLDTVANGDMLSFVINTASGYSPWAAASISSGYLTAPGGHRIGICGEAVIREGVMTGIRNPTSICLRVARDFPGIGVNAAKYKGNLLIAGPPGSGKTTLLRDMIRQLSDSVSGSISVVDERGELFPVGSGFETGMKTDVLTGCGKPKGIEIVLKTMGPAVIAVDEVTSEADCVALEQALWCGVRILATVHAGCRQDLMGRDIYQKLVRSGQFDTLLMLQQDKSWTMERM